nr:AAA family ATPase [Mycobacterium paragordonae]
MDTPMLARILLAVWRNDPCVCIPACPGAGKSRLVSRLAPALAERAGLRVAVAAQTREQALELARRITAISQRAALIVSAAQRRRGASGMGVPTVGGRDVRWRHTSGGEILIGTAARWLYVNPDTTQADVLVVDEAWQCTYADLGALGALAPQVVCVGDPGQIAPVVTGSTARWEGQASGPHQPAPAALIAAHGDEAVTVHELTNSWRLGPATCALLSRHFYPTMPFSSRRPDEAVIDPHGCVLPEIDCRRVDVRHGPNDPMLLEAVAQRVRELIGHSCRRQGTARRLSGADVAVVVPHVAQAGAVRALLAGVPDVLVGTANSLQGLERAAVVAVHPLAGYRSAEAFALDRGRMCVTLSRHRAHLTLLADCATAPMLTELAKTDAEAEHALAVLAAL